MEFAAVTYKHWRVNPEFDKLTLFLVPEEATRMALLRKGQVDAIELSMESARTMKKEGFNTTTGDSTVVAFTVVGAYHSLAKGKPLSDIRVRQALSLAINRQELVDVLFYGLGTLPAPVRTSWEDLDRGYMTPETQQKWKKWASENYRYDPTEAKRLLALAGYANGFTFDFWLVPDGDAPYIQNVVLAAAAYWAKIGVNANVIPTDPNAFKDHRLTTKSTQLVGKMYVDASAYPKLNMIDSVDRWTSTRSGLDLLVGYPDQAKFDDLWTAGMAEMNSVKRAVVIDQLHEMVNSTWTSFAVVGAPYTYAFGPRVNPVMPLPIWNWSSYYPNWKYTGVKQ
jgi:ABC-type transport system substrate-binding protein